MIIHDASMCSVYASLQIEFSCGAVQFLFDEHICLFSKLINGFGFHKESGIFILKFTKINK